jgi:hypothetical protein
MFSLKPQTALELFEKFNGDLFLGLDHIFFLYRTGGVRKVTGPFTVVGKQKQSTGHVVKPSHREQALLDKRLDEIKGQVTLGFVGRAADELRGLVQNIVHFAGIV